MLLAGLPLQSVKSYQPTSFSFADYKAIQPLFREAVPSLLRGLCVLCAEPTKRSSPTSQSKSGFSKELASLSLGVVMTLLPDASLEDVTAFLPTLRHILILSAQSWEDEAIVSLSTFMDVLGCVWKDIFCQPKRCEALLMSLMELFHGLSGVLWKAHCGKQRSGETLDLPWLEGLSSPEGEESRAILGTYAFHVVAAVMNRSEVSESHVTMALEVFEWWLQDALSGSSSDSGDEAESKEDEELKRLMDQALTEDDCVVTSAGETCPWFWLLLTPVPETLIQSHPCCDIETLEADLYLAVIINIGINSFQAITQAGANLQQIVCLGDPKVAGCLGCIRDGSV